MTKSVNFTFQSVSAVDTWTLQLPPFHCAYCGADCSAAITSVYLGMFDRTAHRQTAASPHPRPAAPRPKATRSCSCPSYSWAGPGTWTRASDKVAADGRFSGNRGRDNRRFGRGRHEYEARVSSCVKPTFIKVCVNDHGALVGLTVKLHPSNTHLVELFGMLYLT